MAEPIRLWRGDNDKGYEAIEVYGVNEANALVAKGWNVGPAPAQVEPVKAADVLANAEVVMPAMTEEPVAKPTPKRAGEYGSGPGTQTNKVDAAKKAEVAKEKAADKKAGL